jgi:flagellar hook-basal body complex protein FliE
MARCYAFRQIGRCAYAWSDEAPPRCRLLFFPGANMTVSVNPIASALQQMQSMAAQAAGGSISKAADSSSDAADVGGFASALKASIDKISNDQQNALGEAKAFELGASNVSLNDVMVDMQKANVGFQFGLQVRNKLVAAYNEISQISV